MIISVVEVLVAAFIIWGLFNEEKFVKFEEKIFSKLFAGKKDSCKIHSFSENSGSPTHCA